MNCDELTWDEFKDVLKKCKDGSYTKKQVFYTKLYPSDARDIIENYMPEAQRDLSLSHRNKIKKDMENGLFDENVNNSFSWTKDGLLCDGQHRTNALACCKDDNVCIHVAMWTNMLVSINQDRKHKGRSKVDNARYLNILPKNTLTNYTERALGAFLNLDGSSGNIDDMDYFRKVVDLSMENLKEFNSILDYENLNNIYKSLDIANPICRCIGGIAALMNYYIDGTLSSKELNEIIDFAKTMHYQKDITTYLSKNVKYKSLYHLFNIMSIQVGSGGGSKHKYVYYQFSDTIKYFKEGKGNCIDESTYIPSILRKRRPEICDILNAKITKEEIIKKQKKGA